MTPTNLMTKLIIRSTRYEIAGSKGATWTVEVDPDGVMRCNCPDVEYRRH